MKIILVGLDGYVGSEILECCLASLAVTSVVALVQRDPGETHEKLQVIVQDDLSSYSAEVSKQLGDAEACIWCTSKTVADFPSIEDARRQLVDVPVAIASSIASALEREAKAKPELARKRTFRFVFQSKYWAETDGSRNLWIASDMRHIHGDMETGIQKAIGSYTTKDYKVFIVRPGAITKKVVVKPLIASVQIGILTPFIAVEEFAACMTDLASGVEGCEGVRIFENDEMQRKWGKGLLSQLM